ncbi:MAG: WXG100 family type VII secretion target [Bacilli bacterium]|nr:WXG100 family type VII secretion target [Bacilli bacterium]
MTGSLNISTGELNTVGNNISSVASDVRGIYTTMCSTINQVTSNQAWNSEASKSFVEQFDQIRPSFEKHLEELEALGPSLNQTSNSYADAEQENVSNINKFNDEFQ